MFRKFDNLAQTFRHRERQKPNVQHYARLTRSGMLYFGDDAIIVGVFQEPKASLILFDMI